MQTNDLEKIQGTKANFTIKMPKSGVLSILQVTDTQIIDASQRRFPERLRQDEIDLWQPDKVYERMTRYLDEAVRRAEPDLIVHTGDFTYGEFDDSGKMLDKHIAIMDGYKVPWALAFGNHERDTAIGVLEYVKRITAAKYSLFDGENTYNGERMEWDANYSVLVTDANERPVCLLFIIDNGFGNEEVGVYAKQRAWMQSVAAYYKVPSLVFQHIPVMQFNREVDKLCPAPFAPRALTETEGFGYIGRKPNVYDCIDRDETLFEFYKKIGVKGIFVGHVHIDSFSVSVDGVRLTYGLKTGEYDSHFKDQLGGTKIKLFADGTFTTEHIYVRF